MKYVTATVRGLPPYATQFHVQNNFNPAISVESPCVVSPVVDEIQGDSRTTTVTFRNEKKGRKRTVDELINFFNRSRFGGLSSTISVADHFIGLTPLSGAADAPIQYVSASFSRYNADLIFYVACTSFMVLGVMLLGAGPRTWMTIFRN